MKRSKLILLFSLIIIVVTLASLVACSKTTTTTPAPAPAPTPAPTSKYGGTFRIIPNLGWNPLAVIGYPPEMTYIGAADLLPCLERLVRTDSKGSPVPFLAQTWTVAPDMKSLTLGLKQGVKFHDGSTFNAQAVKWNLDAEIAAKAGGTQSWTSVDVVDDYTVRINLSSWANDIYSTLAGGTGYMISSTAVQKNGLDWARVNPVGTGPFKFKSYQRDVSLKLVRNDDYWQKDAQGNKLPYLDAIEYTFIPDLNTMYVTMTSGGADTWQVMDAHSVKQMTDAGFKSIYICDGAGLLWPDSANPDSPFANLKVRQAVDYAIDRQGIVNSLGFGVWETCDQIATNHSPAHVPGLTRAYNVATAKQLMADAGYPNGFDTQIVGGSDASPEVMAAVQNNLKAIGIRADVKILEMAVYQPMRNTGWQGLLWAPLKGWVNFYDSLTQYFTIPVMKLGSVAHPAGLDDAIAAAALTPVSDPSKVQAAVKITWDNALAIGVYGFCVGNADASNVHDDNWLQLGDQLWTPETTWISK